MYHKHRGLRQRPAPSFPNIDPVDENWREQLPFHPTRYATTRSNASPSILLDMVFVNVDRRVEREMRNWTDWRTAGQSSVIQSLFPVQALKSERRLRAIRDFRGAMVGRTDKGLFSPPAISLWTQAEATRDGAPQIELNRRRAACDLLNGLNAWTQD